MMALTGRLHPVTGRLWGWKSNTAERTFSQVTQPFLLTYLCSKQSVIWIFLLPQNSAKIYVGPLSLSLSPCSLSLSLSISLTQDQHNFAC